ncbi:MAG TPA: hypothetical protein VNW29_05845 [Candidatus Sulfotelmatobacter sp.]|jgi:hypothetical protein|nr:hypothetical protein [Candidatus Sulfotelmatobacter sp.]
MKQLLVILLFFLVGLALAQGITYFNQQQNRVLSSKHSNATGFSLGNAPSESLQGKVASLSGTVNWLSRVAIKTAPLIISQSLQQGEEVSTDTNGKVAIQIKNIVYLSMAPNSHINFIQLLPINFVIMQESGSVTYQDSGSGVLSIRTFDLVTVVNKGVITIAINKDSNSVTVTALRGTIQEGYVDSQNMSTVINITAGQKFIFDITNKQGTVQ